MSLNTPPPGFTDKGAAPGWMIRKPTRAAAVIKQIRDENAAAVARVEADLAAAKAENKELKRRFDAVMGRVERLEAANGVETP